MSVYIRGVIYCDSHLHDGDPETRGAGVLITIDNSRLVGFIDKLPYGWEARHSFYGPDAQYWCSECLAEEKALKPKQE